MILLSHKLQELSKQLLASESTEVGTAEYYNKLEVILEIVRPLDIEVVGNIHDYNREQLLNLLFDIVFKLNARYEERAQYSALVVSEQEEDDSIDLHDPDVEKQTSYLINKFYKELSKLSTGELFKFFNVEDFVSKDPINRYSLARVLLEICSERAIDPKDIWRTLSESKGAL